MNTHFVERRLLHTVKTHKGLTLALGIMIIAVVALSLLPPQFIRILIDDHLIPCDFAGVGRLAALYVSVILFIGMTDFFKGCLITILGQHLLQTIRAEMMRKTERIPASCFSKNPTGVLASRFTTDAENINSLFSDGMISMVIDCLKIVGIVISVFWFSIPLGIFTLILIPLLMAITGMFQKKMLSAQLENLEQLGYVNNHIAESVKNSTMIKLFHKEAYMEKLYWKRLSDNFTTKQRVNFYDSCYAPIIQVIRSFSIALLVFLSARQFGFLGLSVGMAAASIDLLTNLLSPVESLGMELQNMQKGISGIRRINTFYAQEEESRKEAGMSVKSLLKDGRIPELVFENLSFAYEENRPVLQNLNVVITGGSNVTFTGRTGIGKTTLFNLIMGLLQPTQGRILIGGMDAFLIPSKEKRKLFGYVEQNFHFISGSVAEQISLGDPAITDAQIRDACSFVGLNAFIIGLENGYDTYVGKGELFSQGQCQLLAIARAIASNPAILLLDEITANLDSVTEEAVITVLKQAGAGRTILSISHRMASVLNAEHRIALDG